MKEGVGHGIEDLEHKLEDKVESEIKYISHDQLYKNASYLMLSNIAMAVTGFLFWLIAARLYPPEDVGLATALISATALFVIFSTSGVNQMFIRFIPSMSSEDRGKLISTTVLFSIGISAVLSFVFILFIEFLAPKLDILRVPMYALIFIVPTVSYCIFILFDGTFIARRKSSFVFVKNSMQGILKVLFLPFLVLAGGIGIFLSYGVSLIIAAFLSLFLFLKIYSRIRIRPDIKVLRRAFAFLSANYISTIFLQLPNLLFPLIILNMTSGADVAYFYIPWHMFFALFGFIILINSAFLMEGSYEKDIRKDERKTIKLSFLVVIVGIVLFFIFGRSILSLFGSGYANFASLLHVLALSLLPASINQIYLTVKNIRKEVVRFTEMNVFIYSSCLVLGTLLVPYYGVIGIGYGWLIGQTLGVVWIGLESCRHHIRKRIEGSQ